MRLQARGQLHIPQHPSTHDEPDPSQHAISGFGLQAPPDQAVPRPTLCYLWPCNLEVFDSWQRLQTQWREGMGGRSGLDYAAVLAYLREGCGLSGAALQQRFGLLQALERTALEVWAEHKD